MIQQKKDQSFLKNIQKSVKQWDELMEQRATRMDMPMKPQVVAHQLNKFLANHAIICCDTGRLRPGRRAISRCEAT